MRERIVKKQRTNTWYKKVGKKFVPVLHEYDVHGFSEGWYLTQVSKYSAGMRAMHDKIILTNEDRLLVYCLLQEVSEKLSNAISSTKPKEPTKLSRKQKKAWDALCATGIEYITFPCAKEAVDKALENYLETIVGCIQYEEQKKQESLYPTNTDLMMAAVKNALQKTIAENKV